MTYFGPAPAKTTPGRRRSGPPSRRSRSTARIE